LRSFPDVPTVAEVIPGFVASGWFALMAPAGTPDAIVQKVSRDLSATLDEPEVQARLEGLGTFVRPLSPVQTAEFIRSEQELWAPVIRQVGLAAK
jgi:tripartite-type tricarboxylate transporter receptor subunit TctC